MHQTKKIQGELPIGAELWSDSTISAALKKGILLRYEDNARIQFNETAIEFITCYPFIKKELINVLDMRKITILILEGFSSPNE